MSNYKDLYQEVILDHNKKPRNYGQIEKATHQAAGHNPLCGDHLQIALELNQDLICAIGFSGESCAICKASASMMTVAVKNKTRADAEALIQEFLALAKGQLNAIDLIQIGRLAVFAGISQLPTRVKCAILPWHTLHAALNSGAETSTEAEHDPMRTTIGGA